MSSNALQGAIKALAMGGTLHEDQASAAFDVIMSGEATPAQVAALLMGLRVRGESAGEVAGAARALRRAMIVLNGDDPDQLVDTCGTGGGTVTTFNISTAAALLAAGLGLRVAKHGNRSFTSQCGSADVLEQLGVPLDVTPARMADVLRSAGIVFMFAPTMHPAMRHVGPVRRELAVPTVMNIVGPLANPAKAGRQVLGVADPSRQPLLAGALSALGTVHSLVVYGEAGLDEVSPFGLSRVTEIREGRVTSWVLDPADHGVGHTAAGDLAGGSPAFNAELIVELLEGRGPEGARSAIVLNTAAALYVGGKAETFARGVQVARDGLMAGVGMDALRRMRDAYQSQGSA